MKVAVVGCLHGELDRMYRDIEQREKSLGVEIELLLICGDFQSVRNKNDLQCMAVPHKFRQLGTFHEYYSGAKVAPVLTLFIGGNHEASNFLATLPYGGWVAPNIYYLGYSGVVRFKGLRIAGVSGIHKGHDASAGHFERLPFDESSKRSIYHTRNLEVYRMMQLQVDAQRPPLDVVLTHDWPLNIHSCGDVNKLLKRKPFFRQDVNNNALGNPLYQPLVNHLKAKNWFSAHLHVRFEAVIDHGEGLKTSFLALDKCLPRREYLDVIDIEPQVPVSEDASPRLEYDLEWLSVLKKTDRYVSIERNCPIKTPAFWITSDPTTDEEIAAIKEQFEDNLLIPENFQMSEPVTGPDSDSDPQRMRNFANPQSVEFCRKLNISDPMSMILDSMKPKPNPDTIDLDDEEEDEEETRDEGEVAKKLKVGSEEKPVGEVTGLFVIDKKGDKQLKSYFGRHLNETLKTEPSVSPADIQEPPQPTKQLPPEKSDLKALEDDLPSHPTVTRPPIDLLQSRQKTNAVNVIELSSTDDQQPEEEQQLTKRQRKRAKAKLNQKRRKAEDNKEVTVGIDNLPKVEEKVEEIAKNGAEDSLTPAQSSEEKKSWGKRGKGKGKEERKRILSEERKRVVLKKLEWLKKNLKNRALDGSDIEVITRKDLQEAKEVKEPIEVSD